MEALIPRAAAVRYAMASVARGPVRDVTASRGTDQQVSRD